MSDAPQPRRSRFWLIASLCLNFFLIGVIVAGLMVARGRMIAGALRDDSGSLPPETIAAMLPASGTVKMCDAIAGNVDAFRKLGRDIVDARREVFAAFRAVPYDGAKFKAALDRATAAQIALVQLRQSIGLQVTERLDVNERQELSRKLVQRFFAGPRHEQAGHASLRDICAAAGAGSASQLPR